MISIEFKDGQPVIIENGKIRKQYLNVRGYMYVRAEGRVQSVHRLVARHKINGFSDDLQVNHVDGNKLNNAISNLEMVTLQDNLKHAFESGLHSRDIAPVEAVDKTGFGYFYPSMNHAQREGFHSGNISACCNGKRDTHKGFKWNKLRGHAYV